MYYLVCYMFVKSFEIFYGKRFFKMNPYHHMSPQLKTPVMGRRHVEVPLRGRAADCRRRMCVDASRGPDSAAALSVFQSIFITTR